MHCKARHDFLYYLVSSVPETSPTGRAPFQYSSIHLEVLLCRKRKSWFQFYADHF